VPSWKDLGQVDPAVLTPVGLSLVQFLALELPNRRSSVPMQQIKRVLPFGVEAPIDAPKSQFQSVGRVPVGPSIPVSRRSSAVWSSFWPDNRKVNGETAARIGDN
jgi:hypothetical protein